METTEIIEGWPERTVLQRDMIAGYKIAREIGRGASGAVYLAEEAEGGRPVAIKILSPFHTRNPENLARLVRESEALQSIDHPNIVKGYCHGCVENRHYVVMEYVMGETVSALLRRKHRIAEAQALAIIEAVAQGLAAAAQKRIIHRDIKPSNIICTREGAIKLMDFGLARLEFDSSLTTHGAILGTPLYVSPEQARGDINLDIRTDIYSLGITLYHMVVGEPPFSDLNTSLLLTKKITDDIPDPRLAWRDVSDSVAALILRMCQRERQRRIPDTDSLLVAIHRAQEGGLPDETVTWTGTDSRQPSRKIDRVLDPEDVEDPVLRALLNDKHFVQRTRFLDAHEVLFYEDDTSRECYLLMVGRLEILKAGRQIALIDRCGTYIGEMSTLLNSPRTATVRAVEQSVVLELTEETFREFFHNVPELAWHLAVTLAQRLETNNRKLRDTLTKLQSLRDFARVLHRELGD